MVFWCAVSGIIASLGTHVKALRHCCSKQIRALASKLRRCNADTYYFCGQHCRNVQGSGCKLQFAVMPETLDLVSGQKKASIQPQRLPYSLGSVRKARLNTAMLASQCDLLAGQ